MESNFSKSNEIFVENLAFRAQEEDTKFDTAAYSIHVPESTTGLSLLKILVRVVNHEAFTLTGSAWDAENRRPKREGEFIKYQIYFYNFGSTHVLTINCGFTKGQPGNGLIVGYGSYYEFKDLPLQNFIRFLRDPLTPPKSDDEVSMQWKLSVLLLFEIARRTPEKNIDDQPHYNLPVAAGIEMALKVPELQPSQFFSLFRGQRSERDAAFETIKEGYEKIRRQELVNQNMTQEEIETTMKKEFGSMPTIFDDPKGAANPPAQSDEVADLLRAMKIAGGKNDDEDERKDGNDDEGDDDDNREGRSGVQ